MSYTKESERPLLSRATPNYTPTAQQTALSYPSIPDSFQTTESYQHETVHSYTDSSGSSQHYDTALRAISSSDVIPPDQDRTPYSSALPSRATCWNWFTSASMVEWRFRARLLIMSFPFEIFIVTIVVLNSAVMGLETSIWITLHIANMLTVLDITFFTIYIIEFFIKFFALGADVFYSKWNIFDIIVISFALLPRTGPWSVFYSMRVLRILRLFSLVPQLRLVVLSLAASVAYAASVFAILLLIFYTAALLATASFGKTFPDWFGNVGKSVYTMFQISTLESWSMGIVRPVMEHYPWAYMLFIPFICMATFCTLNLFIGILVNMVSETSQKLREQQK